MPFNQGSKGVEFQPGEHLSGLCDGVFRRDQTLLPLLRAGLAAADKCLSIVDGPAAMLSRQRTSAWTGRAISGSTTPTLVTRRAAGPPPYASRGRAAD